LRRVLRLTSATGEFTTPIDIDGKITSGPVLAGGLLLCGTHYGTLCAVSLHDGSSAWTFKLHREGRWMVESRPVVADGKVFFTGPDGRLYSLDLATGSEHWSVDLGVASESCPLIAGAAVYVLTSKGLAAFAGEDGRLLWSCTEGTSWTAATAALAIAAGRLIAATDRLQVFAPVT
jgi:outer membrane protein assembly factor BamB